MEDAELVQHALKALRSEPRIGRQFKPDLIRLEADGAILIEGEVNTVAQKRLALERLAAIPGINGIVDRLHLRPPVPMSDDGILDHLRKTFIQESAFTGARIAERQGERAVLVRGSPYHEFGTIEFEVENGVVTLNGSVPSLTSKRLAGVLAWWVPGSRDVINGIAVNPPEEDAPILIEEAVRIALEKDRFVDASQVRVGIRGRIARLTGLVKASEMRYAAEADAWYVFGVDDVVNEIEVKA
ncbi:BON domain-containing protein [Chelativorans xinjiangense]|uniref:BON domain-containing protein n=1 Tax=Chelativorans xinjiangense TaxID=2681485 RepID=UPI0013581061|nr:BON domain-containing protein [Chelativorans xinjiangense]